MDGNTEAGEAPPPMSNEASFQNCTSHLSVTLLDISSMVPHQGLQPTSPSDHPAFHRPSSPLLENGNIRLSMDPNIPTIPRNIWADMAYQMTKQDFIHAAGIFFKEFYNEIEIQNCTLRNGHFCLKKREIFYRSLAWLKMNRTKYAPSFDYNEVEQNPDNYKLTEDEVKLIDKKIFSELRNQLNGGCKSN